MNYLISLTNRNSNEIYTISFPKNLINFIRYDFTVFMERSIDLCKFYMKTGEYRQDEVSEIRNSIAGCHRYLEHNIHTVFDKIVVDCWIEYICRQNEIGTVTLWNNFMGCKTPFEKAVFSRLNEYRHNQAINQWVNLLKIQEYAIRKVDFVFGRRVKNANEAAAKISYFDLMFNVTANELGYDTENIGDNRVYTVGRTPNSPFTMSHISREIVRNVLADFKYPGEVKNSSRRNVALSDQTAMDAFTSMKAFLPNEPDSIIDTLIKSLNTAPQKVYIPESFKAVVDLEIDIMIENGGVLSKCARCGEYYLRDDNYQYEYCDRVTRNGRSCLELMNVKEEKDTKRRRITASVDPATLSLRCDQLYREMSERLNIDMNQRDFSDWYKYMTAMRENVLNGKASMEDFENFVEYSRAMSFAPAALKSEPVEATPEKEQAQMDKHGREVRPFVFEKIDRDSLDVQENLLYEPVRETKRKRSLQQEPVPQSKIIRGVIPSEQEVIVPVGEKPAHHPRSKPEPLFEEEYHAPNFSDYTPTAKLEVEEDTVAFVKENSPQAVLSNTAVDEADEDVKIYHYDPVKVYNPSDNKKKRRGGEAKSILRSRLEIQPLQAPSEPPRLVADEASFHAEYEPNSDVRPFQFGQQATAVREPFARESAVREPFARESAAREPVAREPAVRESVAREPAVREPFAHESAVREPVTREPIPTLVPPTKESRVVSSYLHTASDLGGETNVPEEVRVPSEPRQERPKTFRMENAENIGFTDVLSGFERNDGFEEPSVTEEPPTSHKTKRVMDAIFKPSRPSASINIGKGKNDD